MAAIIDSSAGLKSNSSLPAKTSLLDKILNIIRKIINFICCWQNNPFKLSPQEQRDFDIMKGRAQPLPANAPAPLSDHAVTPIPISAPIPQPVTGQLPVIVIPQQQQAQTAVFKKEVYNQFMREVERIVGEISDITFETKVEQKIIRLKESTEGLTQHVEKLTKFILKMGQTADKNYGIIINNQEFSQTINEEYSILLKWLTMDDFHDNPTQEQTAEYLTRLRNEMTIAFQAHPLQEYLGPTIQWIFTETHPPLTNFFAAQNLTDSERIKESNVLIVQYLIMKKIDHYYNHLETTLQGSLSIVCKEFMRESIFKWAASIEAKQLIDIIQSLDWPELIDSVADSLFNQTHAFVEGVRTRENYLKSRSEDKNLQITLASHQKRVNAVPANDEEKEIQKFSKEELEKNAATENEEAANKYIQGYINAKTVTRQFAVHPLVRTLIDKAGKADDAKKAEHGYFIKVAEQIIDMILPDDTDNLIFRINELKLPPEVIKIDIHTQNIYKLVVSNKVRGLIEKIYTQWRDTIVLEIKKLAVLEARKILKEFLVSKLTEKLNHYTDPDEINELLVDVVLSDVLIPQLIQTTAKHELSQKIPDYAPHFLGLMGDKSVQSLKEIQKGLLEATQKLLPHVKFDKINMTDAQFNVAIDPLIKELEGRFKIIYDKDPKAFDQSKVVNLLSVYFGDDNTVNEERPVYGNIVTNLLSKMSTAGSIAKWSINRFEKAISDMLVSMLGDIRRSPDYLMSIVVEKLPTYYTREKLKELLYGDPVVSHDVQREQLSKLQRELNQEPKPTEERATELKTQIEKLKITTTKKKLEEQLQTISSIVHDLSLAKMEDFSRKAAAQSTYGLGGGIGAWLGKKSVSYALGTPQDIYQVVNDLYAKLVGNHLRNKSLAFQIVDMFLKKVLEECQKLRSESSSKTLPAGAT